MDTIKQEDLETVLPSDTTEVESKTETTEQDPLKTELEKVQRKGRSKTEKLLYTKKRIDEQLKELGVEEEVPEDDDQPMTVGMFRKLQSQTATKTAIDLADEVTNATERELLKYHLENTIRSTGNPQEDFKLAMNQVNAVKNQQILEEMNRKPEVRTHPTGTGVPAKPQQKVEDYTEAELAFMKAPFNLTKEQIVATRSIE